jgi:hypothetical protein
MIRSTKSLIFMRTDVTVEDRCVVTVQGVFTMVRKEVGPASS